MKAVFVVQLASLLLLQLVSAWIDYPPTGTATMTHFSQPENYVGSCGCTPGSTHFPTVALSQMAFGSSTAYGPGCGKCFNITLLNTFLSNPPFYPPAPPSIVIKVTDLCPISSDWCTATQDEPNQAGVLLNFDLAFPSPGIPDDFFPSDEPTYGYTDFGVWNVSYDVIPCSPNWAGSSDASAMGSVANLGTSVCCPADPTGSSNSTCPSYSDENGTGTPPNTTTTSSAVATSNQSSRKAFIRVIGIGLWVLLDW